MNYYERHLGDYAKDTAHLSLVEHGVYTLLLDRIYATEAGIPIDQVHRIARARTADERAAVDAVVAEFFAIQDGVLVNGRALQEIEKARVRIEAARTNGRTGGRPKANPEETHREPTGFVPGNPDRTQTKAHHVPDTSLHTPESQKQEQKRASPSAPQPKGTRLPPDWMPAPEQIAWAKAKRPELDVPAEAECFRDYWHAKPGKDGRKTDWTATWRNWIRNSRANPRAGPQPRPQAGGSPESPPEDPAIARRKHEEYMRSLMP